MLLKHMTYLKDNNQQGFPYNLSFFEHKIELSDVTFIVGDNGSGKSTMLELLSHELKLFQIGKPLILPKPVHMNLKYTLRRPQGFYFSAEDFTSYIHRLNTDKQEAIERIKAIDVAYQHKSLFAKQQAKSPYGKTLYEIEKLYDKDLLTSSHGESYLAFFKSRIKPNQLIILDEPETPLSFDNQLALLYMIKEAIDEGAQFIIATHSPILLAYPDAKIYQIDDMHFRQTNYQDLESIQSLKHFLNEPNHFFRHLFKKP